MNTLKTVFFMTLLAGIFLLLGWLFGGTTGIIVAFVFALAMNFFTYWFSDRLALAMNRARQVSQDEEPRLHQMVEEVAYLARLPKPKVYIINNDSPNAFATGRSPKHAAVAVTTGMMRILDERELMAVLGHELGHVRNRDILISAIVATIASAIMFIAMIARWSLFFGGFGRSRNQLGGIIGIVAILAMVIIAPIAAMLIRMAISRAREYAADEAGAYITGTPLALASALEKLQRGIQIRPMEASPSTAHLFIVNPFKGQRQQQDLMLGFFSAEAFSTHPPLEKRIQRLHELARRTGMLA